MNSLKGLSDKALVRQLHQFVHQEKRVTLEVLSHLAEVSHRELYLSKGFSTLSDYCVCELGYGESSAWRRVRAARVIGDVPRVYDLMKSGQLTLSAVLQVANVLKPQNQAELLPRVTGKSKDEIERIVAEYQMPVPLRDQVKPRIVKKEITVGTAPAGTFRASAGGRCSVAAPRSVLDCGSSGSLKSGEIPLRSEGENNPIFAESSPKKVVYEKMYEIRFAGDEELMELMTWMRSYLSHRFPKGASYQDMFKYAMRYVREREDLAKRAERRERRQKQTKQQSKRSRNTENRGVPLSRHIAVKEKEKVWIRDKGRCTYKGPDGRTCNSTRNLQYDHYPIPFARGGPSTADNLRLLCAVHNRLEAERVYGKQHMDRFRRRE